MRPTLAARTGMHRATELDRLDAECFRERSIVAAPLADHCLGCVALEEELDDPLSLGTDDAVEEHAVSICPGLRGLPLPGVGQPDLEWRSIVRSWVNPN